MVEIKSDLEAGRIKKRCEICNSDHPHPCWLRGPEFQPDWLRKRIEQINLRDGNKPTEPPTEKITPPKASFSKQKSLRFNHMSLQQDDSDRDIDALLDSIQSNIDQQVDEGTLSVKPKLASIKLSAPTDSDAADVNSIRGSVDALQVEDYTSVYGMQDFC
jgi:hypothetical protein